MAYLRFRYARFGIGVGALIRDERGRILIVHRTYSRVEPWALPGGWLEGREGVERTLERELMEETGLRVRVGSVAAIERTDFSLVVLLRAELLDGIGRFRASPEVSELAWLELSELDRLSPINARLLRRALA
jgi:ADP-ribose pyrophosphatase YjhB (NUDIX family)